MKCVQCGSEDIALGMNVFDRGHTDIRHNLMIGIFKRPKAMFFKRASAVQAKANVCADCGFVMLSVSSYDAKRLKGMRQLADGK